MSGDQSSDNEQARDDGRKSKNLIRSKYTDIMIKVDEDIYHLDRLELALKSDYFENLFTKDFSERNCNLIEMPLLDSDTFGNIIDIIYGKDLKSVFNVDNYVLMLRAMDYFQMEIGWYSFQAFVTEQLERMELLDVKIFEAYRFVVEYNNYEHLLSPIFRYLSRKLEKASDHVEILQMPLHHFLEIVAENDEDRNVEENRMISVVCAKWICHDVENRLAYTIKLVNAARARSRFSCDVNNEIINIDLSNISDEKKLEIVQRYFYRMLSYDGLMDISDGKIPKNVFDSITSYTSEDKKPERNKLCEYLENGTFYDITVRIEDKIYKLHRSVLQSKCGYFAEIFSAEHVEGNVECTQNTSNYRDKNREYVIKGIDQATFDMIIQYVYLNKVCLTHDNTLRYLKAADALKITELLEKCVDHMTHHLESKYDRVTSDEIIEILDFIYKKVRYEDLYILYLRHHLKRQWPNIANVEQFCSISCDMLEDVISSTKFFMNNPLHVLDIGSTWITHDVQNRYRFISRIATAIKNYGLSDFDDSAVETAVDFGNCSRQLVRERLLDVLSSISLIPFDTFSSNEARKKSMPLFITSTSSGIFDIFNERFDRMATICFSIFEKPHIGPFFPMSATAINDNVFIYCVIGSKRFFRVYNVPSNRVLSLAIDPRISFWHTLLACAGEIYCCNKTNGRILKYSFVLNRWAVFSSDEPDKKDVMFTSDGGKLYRMYKYDLPESDNENDPKSSYMVEAYGFEQKGWICLPNIPSPLPKRRYSANDKELPVCLTIINDCDIAILCRSTILWFNRDSQTWHTIWLPEDQRWYDFTRSYSVVGQGEDGILQVFDENLYRLSLADQTWSLIREIPDERKVRFFVSDKIPYDNIIAIHRPIVRAE